MTDAGSERDVRATTDAGPERDARATTDTGSVSDARATTDVRHARQLHLMRAASALGITVHDRMPELGVDLVIYRHGAKSVPVLEGRYDHELRARDFFLTEDKHATKLLLSEAGFTTPRGFAFAFTDTPASEGDDDLPRLTAFATEAVAALSANPAADAPALAPALAPVVVKPRAGMRGDAVRMDLVTAAAVAEHIADRRHLFRSWIVEEQVDGKDLRLQLVDGELVAACVREPASVTGDGCTRLAELVETHRTAVAAANPDNRLVVDTETQDLLAAQGLGLDDVPAAGRAVRLKRTANLAKGGVGVDVTESLHADFAPWAASVADLFGTRILAIDALCAKPHGPPTTGTTILEVNTAPEWVHHTFSRNRTHDIATRVLRSWFDL
ncbi:hypothetical protein [Streptomyces silvensis]|uniref:ATP-grasp domain-containing protein n=1 Tax=Streptomyces silvensis TaxID=1765722 RepID=A0A0W7X5W8_9ACTN|nr:hypothetical protein [Streptomyces silvensis]KUF18171.1 hypothetical protein AT728_24635 [Streptomyces silvensis]